MFVVEEEPGIISKVDWQCVSGSPGSQRCSSNCRGHLKDYHCQLHTRTIEGLRNPGPGETGGSIKRGFIIKHTETNILIITHAWDT